MVIDYLIYGWLAVCGIGMIALFYYSSTRKEEEKAGIMTTSYILAFSWLLGLLVFLGIAKSFCINEIHQYIEKQGRGLSLEAEVNKIRQLTKAKADDFALNCVRFLKRQGYELRNSYEVAIDYCFDHCPLCYEIYKTLEEEYNNEVIGKCEDAFKFKPLCKSPWVNERELFKEEVFKYCKRVANRTYSLDELERDFRREAVKRLKTYTEKEK